MVPVSFEIYEKFDAFLSGRQLTFEGLIVGGAAFGLLSAREAFTEDVDFLQPIPPAIRKAAEDFAAKEGLKNDWFNERARVVNDYLKFGYGKTDVIVLYEGKALCLKCPSRENLVISKLCRILDSGPRAVDIEDIRSLRVDISIYDSAANHLLKKEKTEGGDIEKASQLIAVIRRSLYGS